MTTFKLKDHFHLKMWKGGGAETVSGAGSTLRYTENLRPKLSELIAGLGVKRFLDAPCGDFNWMQHVALGDVEYTGLDIIEDVISMNRQRFGASNRLFFTADITRDPLPSADLFLCRDLLLHLPYQSIADLFENIISSDLKHILITSYVNSTNRDLDKPGKARKINLTKDPFDFRISSDHVRLPDWIPGFPERHLLLFERSDFVQSARLCIPRLREAPSTAVSVTPLTGTSHKGVAMWRAGELYAIGERPADSASLRGWLPATVLEYEHLSGRRSLLTETIFASLQAFGFFTKHAPRYLEYPWVIESIRNSAPGSVLDLGAGVSPVPLILAANGWEVTTIDDSQTKRSLAQSGNLNEWGFLDYSEVDRRIRSVNQNFSRAEFAPGSFDVIYSVSVIEHMPAAIRRDVFGAVGRCLKSGGTLVLTLDLAPGTLRLWNLDRGKPVEKSNTHGTLDDVLSELREAGLEIDHLEIRRSLPRSRTDIVLLQASNSA